MTRSHTPELRFVAANPRNILCLSPTYARSFGTFEHAYSFRGSRAFMPPQGLLVVAATLPGNWAVRFIDENIAPARAGDFAWADVVFISGMHVQRRAIHDINARAHAAGKPTVLGGPSVSACPENYSSIDYLHLGELGDGTAKTIKALDDDPRRPAQQIRFETHERARLDSFPVPAYDLAAIKRYFINNVQFSSGCPYQCEFCDIPALYGRNPRLKTTEQVTRELDAMIDAGAFGAAYFVDDNFIGNRRAARELVEALIAWQNKRGYPLSFSCEATLNIAKHAELLKLMREANFNTVFCGIETPEIDALTAMKKTHNAVLPLYESIETLNSYGFEIVSGIILGLDTDTPETPDRIIEFIRRSNIPMLTINLLQALPRTALYERLAREGRIIEDETRESNVVFRLPYEVVVSSWKRCIAEAYEPSALYARYGHNLVHTYPNRFHPPGRNRASFADIAYGMRLLAGVFVRVGGLSSYRRIFWNTAMPLLRAGQIEELIHIGLVGHHLIKFTREALSGRQNASFYAPAERQAA